MEFILALSPARAARYVVICSIQYKYYTVVH